MAFILSDPRPRVGSRQTRLNPCRSPDAIYVHIENKFDRPMTPEQKLREIVQGLRK